MACSTVLFSLFLMSPCTERGGSNIDEAIAEAVPNPQRPVEDVEKDINRKPEKVLAFFEIKPGMTVLDLFSGCSYYTEILNTLVGDNGEVIAHTNRAYIDFVGESYEQRYADDRLANSQAIVSEADDHSPPM